MADLILIISDDPKIADLCRASLRGAGYRVRMVAHGQAGLALVTDLIPDLVLIDLMPSGHRGLPMCTAIRAVSSVPVIVLATRIGADDHLQALAAGADDCLVKPFSQPELVARVRAILRRVAAFKPPARAQTATLKLAGIRSVRPRPSRKR